MEIRLKEIAQILGGTIDGNEDIIIKNIAGIEDAECRKNDTFYQRIVQYSFNPRNDS